GVEAAAGADRALLAAQDPGRDVPALVRLAVGHDRMARVRPAVVAADEISMLGKQVDDLALSLVSPLRANDDGGRHQASSSAQWDETDARAKPAHPFQRHPTSGCLGAPTTTVAGTSEKSAALGGGMRDAGYRSGGATSTRSRRAEILTSASSSAATKPQSSPMSKEGRGVPRLMRTGLPRRPPAVASP